MKLNHSTSVVLIVTFAAFNALAVIAESDPLDAGSSTTSGSSVKPKKSKIRRTIRARVSDPPQEFGRSSPEVESNDPRISKVIDVPEVLLAPVLDSASDESSQQVPQLESQPDDEPSIMSQSDNATTNIMSNSGNTETTLINGVGNNKITKIANSGNNEHVEVEGPIEKKHRRKQKDCPCEHSSSLCKKHAHRATPKVMNGGPLVQIIMNRPFIVTT